jgi:hypothetical protein
MKKLLLALVLLLSINRLACAQGTLVYDQQVTTNDNIGASPFGIPTYAIGTNQPIGQSFTPTFSAIGFVRFYLNVPAQPSGTSTLLWINLWSGSISNGILLASTSADSLSPGFNTFATFYFTTPAALTPGTVYYLQPFIQSGNAHTAIAISSILPPYSGGMAFINDNQPQNPNTDIWFREGIVATPEPATGRLFLAAALCSCLLASRQKRLSQTNAVAGTTAPAPP